MKARFKPIGALWAIVMAVAEIGTRIINILTWGKIGKMWMIELAMFNLTFKHAVIWSDEEESPNAKND